MQALARASLSALEAPTSGSQPFATPTTSFMPVFQELFEGDEVSPSEIPLPKQQWSDPFGLLHSSGTRSHSIPLWS